MFSAKALPFRQEQFTTVVVFLQVLFGVFNNFCCFVKKCGYKIGCYDGLCGIYYIITHDFNKIPNLSVLLVSLPAEKSGCGAILVRRASGGAFHGPLVEKQIDQPRLFHRRWSNLCKASQPREQRNWKCDAKALIRGGRMEKCTYYPAEMKYYPFLFAKNEK